MVFIVDEVNIIVLMFEKCSRKLLTNQRESSSIRKQTHVREKRGGEAVLIKVIDYEKFGNILKRYRGRNITYSEDFHRYREVDFPSYDVEFNDAGAIIKDGYRLEVIKLRDIKQMLFDIGINENKKRIYIILDYGEFCYISLHIKL